MHITDNLGCLLPASSHRTAEFLATSDLSTGEAWTHSDCGGKVPTMVVWLKLCYLVWIGIPRLQGIASPPGHTRKKPLRLTRLMHLAHCWPCPPHDWRVPPYGSTRWMKPNAVTRKRNA